MRGQMVLRGAVLASAVMAAVSGAYAEDPPGTGTQATQQADGRDAAAATPEPQTGTTTPGTVVETGSERRPARWDVSGGYESASDDTAYAYFGPSYNRPIRDNLALRFSLRANHLSYEFGNGEGGRTEVSGPGLSPAIGLRFGGRNWVQVSTGLSIRNEERVVSGPAGIVSQEDGTEVGLSLGADAWYNTSRRSNIHAMVHYGALSNYTWARLAGRHQVTNFDWRAPVTFYLGAEVVGQGNEDIRSFQVGPVLEMALGRSQLSLSARGGYRHSSYDVGDSKGGPYFGVGLWKRF